MDFPIYDHSDLVRQGAILGFHDEYRWLSNFWFAKVEAYGIEFPTVEHAYVASKIDPNESDLFGASAEEKMRGIAALDTPGKAKRAGRKLKLREDWEQVKEGIMLELSRQKFSHPELAKKLVATDNRPLFELNFHGDRIWGVVEAEPGKLEGFNLLGQALMRVRSGLIFDMGSKAGLV